MFKSNLDFEKYLDVLDIHVRTFRYANVNFRLGCHELEKYPTDKLAYACKTSGTLIIWHKNLVSVQEFEPLFHIL